MDASRLTAVPPFRLRVPQAGSFLIVAQKALFHKRNNEKNDFFAAYGAGKAGGFVLTGCLWYSKEDNNHTKQAGIRRYS